MNTLKIEKLLEKFYNGETSLQEEQELRQYFCSRELPPQLRSIHSQFFCMEKDRNEDILDDSFDQEVLKMIDDGDSDYIRIKRKTMFYSVAAIAATILILVSVFTKFNPFSNNIESTLSDPEIAYSEARKILLYVSGNLNKGTDQLNTLARFDQSISDVSSISKFDDGMDQANKIGKYNRIDQIFKNQAGK